MAETPEDKRQRDFNDLQNERAGRETGRIERFGVAASGVDSIKREEKRRRAYRDQRTWLLANDLEYRQMYDHLGDNLRTAEVGADHRIAALSEQLHTQNERNETLRRDAARGPDGRPVFRFDDGLVVDENGNVIAPEIVEGIIWPESAPSAEDYFAGIAQADELTAAVDAWLAYRNETLGSIRNRYDDPDTPMTKEEMREALEEIQAMAPDLPKELISSASETPVISSAPQTLLTLD